MTWTGPRKMVGTVLSTIPGWVTVDVDGTTYTAVLPDQARATVASSELATIVHDGRRLVAVAGFGTPKPFHVIWLHDGINYNTLVGTTWQTVSATIAPNYTAFLWVYSTNSTPTVSGMGLTWTSVVSNLAYNGKIILFVAQAGPSGASGTITVSGLQSNVPVYVSGESFAMTSTSVMQTSGRYLTTGTGAPVSLSGTYVGQTAEVVLAYNWMCGVSLTATSGTWAYTADGGAGGYGGGHAWVAPDPPGSGSFTVTETSSAWSAGKGFGLVTATGTVFR